MMNVMICTSWRCGSHYFHSLLESTQCIDREKLSMCFMHDEPEKKMPSESTYIWLRRTNFVRRAISHIKAEKVKVYSCRTWMNDADTAAKRAKLLEVDISLSELGAWIETEKKYDCLWADFFQAHEEYDPIVVFYEELVKNPERIVSEILDRLNLMPNVWPPASNYVKLSDTHTERVYHAYQKAKEAYDMALRE